MYIVVLLMSFLVLTSEQTNNSKLIKYRGYEVNAASAYILAGVTRDNSLREILIYFKNNKIHVGSFDKFIAREQAPLIEYDYKDFENHLGQQNYIVNEMILNFKNKTVVLPYLMVNCHDQEDFKKIESHVTRLQEKAKNQEFK
jgi:hypothetical protein